MLLRADLLGPLRARLGPAELPLGPARQRAVFATLAARAGEVVSRRELIDAVWGESAPASADGSIYTYISGLRRCLAAAGEPLQKTPGGYRLVLETVDLTEFERLHCAAQSAGEHRVAVEACTAALELWRGEPLSGVPGPFAERERDRLRELWVGVQELRAAALLELGEHVEVVSELTALVADHPLRESLRLHLLVALQRSGRRAEALEVFHDARRVLRAELGVRPGPALRALHEQLLAEDTSISHDTREVLRLAALLGPEFTVAEVAAVTHRSAADLVGVFDEAVAAGVVVDAGLQFRIRDRSLRQALYDELPEPARSALHRQAAEALAVRGAPVRRVAEQLIASPVDAWVCGWLSEHSAELASTAPHCAVEVLQRVLQTSSLSVAHRETLTAALVKVLFRMARNPEAEARQAIALSTDPARTAELRQLYAAMLHRRGQTERAREVIAQSTADPALPAIWHSRHLALLANFHRGDMSDTDAAERDAQAARAAAQASGDAYLLAHAYQTLWQICSMRRDHARALRYVDRALAVVRDRADLADIHFDLLDNRMFTLQNLDRLTEARDALRSARELTEGHALPSGLQVSAAVHYYWEGRWDEALAELGVITEDVPEITFYGLREPGPAALLKHGVAALIAGHRDDRGSAAAHLKAAEVHTPSTRPERESFDFLLVARALAAEQAGEPGRALSILSPVLNVSYAQMMLRHQWLPGIARLAVELGDRERAHAALAACEYEADRETVPARAMAALQWCRALIDGDLDAGQDAVDHHRRAGRYVELAGALEDLAELHAKAGRPTDARRCLAEAVEWFTELSARWDASRAQARLSRHGVHLEVLRSRRRASHAPPRARDYAG